MRTLIAFSCAAVLMSAAGNSVFGAYPEDPFRITAADYNSDPVTGRRYWAALKVSTLQVLFSEAPFTVEVFGKKNFSSQFQAGIIFPMKEGSFLQEFFESSGEEGMASERGLISYRNSPFNNHGMVFKFELRKYGRKFYFAPQLMYKYLYFKDDVFRVNVEGKPFDRMESKRSGIYGLGIMAGRQTYFMKHVTDWYVGVGIRRRTVNSTINRLVDADYPGNVTYPGSTERRTSVYPFINFGFRTGFVL